MSGSGMALWQRVVDELPLIAILRGIIPADAVGVAAALQSAGFLCVEIPLNTAGALDSIRMVRDRFDGELLVGAGTVLTQTEVTAVHEAGGQIVVSPNANPEVIAATRRLNLISLPGFATPTEALVAIAAGAHGLKLFPAESISAAGLRAMKTVLPRSYPIFPVGGVTTATMPPFIAAGAAGFGIGSSLYSAGASAEEVGRRAVAFVRAWASTRSEAVF
jgi:2-dehydro-3-deoxyphosphogalactonate aldolase